MNLRPDQEAGATFLYEHDRAMLLGDVGSGKTITTLVAMYEMIRDHHVGRWLVVAPKRVCTKVWPAQIKDWKMPLSIGVAVGEGKTSMAPAERERIFRSNAQIIVVNFEVLQTLPDDLMFDAVVIDELTKFKNGSAVKKTRRTEISKGKRFAAMFDRLEQTQIRWGLTGSFTDNGLKDVYGQCKIIDQSHLGRSKSVFLQKFFIPMCPERDQWVPRPGALELVMSAIKPMIYMLDNEEYRKTLPSDEPAFHPISCVMDMTAYRKMQRDCTIELEGQTITAVNAGVVQQKLQQLASGFLYKTYKAASSTPGKFITNREVFFISPHKFDTLDELLEENQHSNTIIFYWYEEELAELKRRYKDAVEIDRHGAIERWNAGKLKKLLMHPMSAGHGLNLQFGGHHGVFVSLPWSYELFKQAWGRLHRGGQTKLVRIYLLLTDKTVDWRIWQALQDRKDYSALSLDVLKEVS